MTAGVDLVVHLCNKKKNYSPISGTLSLLGGMLSEIAIKNTVILSKVVTPILIFSPLSGGIRKPRNPTRVISRLGKIMLNT
jgi:hypothetical protein